MPPSSGPGGRAVRGHACSGAPDAEWPRRERIARPSTGIPVAALRLLAHGREWSTGSGLAARERHRGTSRRQRGRYPRPRADDDRRGSRLDREPVAARRLVSNAVLAGRPLPGMGRLHAHRRAGPAVSRRSRDRLSSGSRALGRVSRRERPAEPAAAARRVLPLRDVEARGRGAPCGAARDRVSALRTLDRIGPVLLLRECVAVPDVRAGARACPSSLRRRPSGGRVLGGGAALRRAGRPARVDPHDPDHPHSRDRAAARLPLSRAAGRRVHQRPGSRHGAHARRSDARQPGAVRPVRAHELHG